MENECLERDKTAIGVPLDWPTILGNKKRQNFRTESLHLSKHLELLSLAGSFRDTSLIGRFLIMNKSVRVFC